MYTLLLVLHSWWRWVVLAAGLAATFQAWRGWLGRLPWPASGKSIPNLAFISALDLQFVFGLLLYMTSPTVTLARNLGMGTAMKDPQLRFWSVEHVVMMLVATGLAHVGFAKAKRGTEADKRYRVAALFFTVALLCMLSAIPWPGRAVGRPMFRFDGA